MVVNTDAARRWRRRLVLAGALAAGLAVATALPTREHGSLQLAVDVPLVAAALAADAPAIPAPPALPAPPAPAAKAKPSPPVVQKPVATEQAVPATPDNKPSGKGKAPARSKPDPAAADVDPTEDTGEADEPAKAGRNVDVEIGRHGVTVRNDRTGKRVHVQGFGNDAEFDSFDQFVEQAPWLAALVFGVVFAVFLIPLLIVILLIWYKVRKTRMMNDAMVKLAERGVVPPAEALQSIAGNGPSVAAGTAGPLYEQAREMRRRAAWSDLRKGVVMIAVGLAFVFYSMVSDGAPNWIGLVLLFLGIGYCVLYVFEERTAPRGANRPPAPGGT